MIEIRQIEWFPEPSDELRPYVTYLRLGCSGCVHSVSYELDGVDLHDMREEADPDAELVFQTLQTTILRGLPFATVVENDKEAFLSLECRGAECEHLKDIQYASDKFSLMELTNQLSGE